MGLPDAELKIVSLVRYVDACDPAHRHRDCPYAVERDGTLSCREECREVLASALGHARAATPASRTFDARGLLLGETGPTPHVLWHTSSLLQVLVDVAQTHPLLDDGTLNLRRLVDATSALGALGCRGLDPDRVVRRGIAETMKLTLAGWLERLEFSDEPRGKRRTRRAMARVLPGQRRRGVITRRIYRGDLAWEDRMAPERLAGNRTS
jgi:hypothetical protein